jgi:hypothetical protein
LKVKNSGIPIRHLLSGMSLSSKYPGAPAKKGPAFHYAGPSHRQIDC